MKNQRNASVRAYVWCIAAFGYCESDRKTKAISNERNSNPTKHTKCPCICDSVYIRSMCAYSNKAERSKEKYWPMENWKNLK